jgi:hypothetical protein
MVRTPVRHDISRESQLCLEELVENMVILACPYTIELIIAAHNGSDSGTNGIIVRPKIDLMHSSVIDVTGHRSAVEFLFVSDIMLDTGLDASPLHFLDSDGRMDAVEVGIRAPCLPVATCLWYLADRASHRTE